jgi:LPS-assembly protein
MSRGVLPRLAHLMKTRRSTTLVFLLLIAAASRLIAAEDSEEGILIESVRDSDFVYHIDSGLAVVTNDFVVHYKDAVLTAQGCEFNTNTGVISAEGNVYLEQGKLVWRGDRLEYNFYTRQIEARSFRAGRSPVFAGGQALTADTSNKVFTATDSFLTTDDVANPALRLRTRRLRIVPGKYFEARHAVLYAGNVPIFYFPYYRRNIEKDSNQLNFTPGYRSSYGAYVLGVYDWYWNKQLHGALHLDYRSNRGFGEGADASYDLGQWGKGTLQGYYLHDLDPNYDTPTNAPPNGSNRYLVNFIHQANPYTNLSAQVVLRKQSDAYVTHDFFEAQYRENPQPDSYLEVDKFWSNFSLNFMAQPQVNDFFETIERLPDLKLSGTRQQLGASPFFYESETSAGYFRHAYASGGTNVDYAAFRADTFHQLLLPQTFFGWLNVIPRAGGRFTYYGETRGDNMDLLNQEDRWVFNTGAEVSFKASQVWPSVKSQTFEVNGLRHIIQPSFNYAYIPNPSVATNSLPQFDYEMPSLRLLPITFPNDNSIDSIDSMNVMRLGLRNKLQTKRSDGVDNLVNWDLYTDWYLTPQADQGSFSDLFSDLDLKPVSWITLTSELRVNVERNNLRLANHVLTFAPNDTWSWAIGHYYLRDSPDLGLPEGYDQIRSTLYLRFSEDWGLRFSHRYDLRDSLLLQQYYTIYRDLGSWTAALTFRIRNNLDGRTDYGVAFTFSFKALPRFHMDDDRNKPSLLLGS